MLRKSKKREQILKKIGDLGLVTADELNKKLPHIDKVTIYRNLKLFVKNGEVREIRLKKGVLSYELLSDRHEHFICTDCGKVRRIEVDDKELLEYLYTKNPWLKDFNIEDVELNVRGSNH